MTITLDMTKPYTQVGGREPLVYLQFGCGFDRSLSYIGRFTANGEPMGQAKALFSGPVDEPVRRGPGRPKKAQ